jgi:two-component system sensor histidine kinase KdpD
MYGMVSSLPPSFQTALRRRLVNRRIRTWAGRRNWPAVGRQLRPYLLSAIGVALAALAGLGMTSLARLPNVSMVFLLAVLFAAVRFGIWPALFASGLSFLTYNFFFIEPLYTLSVAQPHELLALLVLLAVALLTSALAGRAREEARNAEKRAQASRRLYEFAARLSGVADPQSVVDGAAIQVHAHLQRRSVILLSNGDALTISAAWPPEDELDQASMAAASCLYRDPSGPDFAAASWLFLPLRTPDGPVGVIGVGQDRAEPPLDPAARTFFQTIAELTATALERARLGNEISSARSATEAERVRNTLLASISHDFRTPLASVLGAATSLIEYGQRLPESASLDLLTQIRDEAEHLDGMVRNLLAMTRVEAGALEVRRDWIDVRELFDRVVSVAKRRGATQRFEVAVAEGLPFIGGDPILLAQALSNVVGNAIRYAGPQARIVIEARPDGAEIVLSITDDGPGIPPGVLPHVFEKFVRAPTSGDAGEGTGLGLAIAKGIIEAHGGSIRAESPANGARGTRVTMRLPIKENAP